MKYPGLRRRNVYKVAIACAERAALSDLLNKGGIDK